MFEIHNDFPDMINQIYNLVARETRKSKPVMISFCKKRFNHTIVQIETLMPKTFILALGSVSPLHIPVVHLGHRKGFLISIILKTNQYAIMQLSHYCYDKLFPEPMAF